MRNDILSLFDGMSCARIALDRAGIKYDNYYASEINFHSIKAAQNAYPDTIQMGDVRNWEKWEIDNIDIILSGFPCQPYSVIGKRKGLTDVRGGNIVDTMFKIIKKYQPKICFFENVLGLLSISGGSTFKIILKEINNCGYAVDWIVINSSLVSAQNRKRVYIIAKRLDLCQGMAYSVMVGSKNKRPYRDLFSEVFDATQDKGKNKRYY